MSRCSFLPATYAPTATALVRDVTVSATKPRLGQPNQAQASAQQNAGPMSRMLEKGTWVMGCVGIAVGVLAVAL